MWISWCCFVKVFPTIFISSGNGCLKVKQTPARPSYQSGRIFYPSVLVFSSIISLHFGCLPRRLPEISDITLIRYLIETWKMYAIRRGVWPVCFVFYRRSDSATIFALKSGLYCVIVRVRVVLKRTVVGDWRFDNLSGSHLQSQVNSIWQSMMLCHDGFGWKTRVKFVISHWWVSIRLLLVNLVGFWSVLLSWSVKPGSHLCDKHNTSDISISISTRKKEHVPFSCAYAYFTCVMLVAQVWTKLYILKYCLD